MLKGVEDVCIIDSFVVDKATFLNAYKISEESGKLFTFNEFFKTEGDHPGMFMKQKSEIKFIIAKRVRKVILTSFQRTSC